ncbi:MAG: class I SAM-dependent rRNA methyltransferase [Alphaproteobacteria bacterium]|nr:class I SAM-dependent rRNA methyltransferase [Alphaproteobacteria bacterium]
MKLPQLTVKNTKRFQGGHPWIFSNEIEMDTDAKALPKGSLVRLNDTGGQFIACGYFNPNSLIAVRILSRKDRPINEKWFADVMQNAARVRDVLMGSPYYRLIHGEADGLPGVVIDRYGDAFVVQLNTAGADMLGALIVGALETVFSPKHIIIRQDQNIRKLEGIDLIEPEDAMTSLLVEGVEGGIRFVADITAGQKTGWFYDQRDNRKLFASLVRDKSVLDCYSFTGSFGLYAAKAGAASVVCLDSSKPALDIAEKNAALNKVTLQTTNGDAFQMLRDMEPASFDCVVIDPPAFVKVKKDFNSGVKGYAKLVAMAHKCVKKGGYLMFTSCSHHVGLEDLRQVVQQGLRTRSARIIKHLSAGMDHPVHPHLPETNYLKGFLIQMD